jgi:hypothetical protein
MVLVAAISTGLDLVVDRQIEHRAKSLLTIVSTSLLEMFSIECFSGINAS